METTQIESIRLQDGRRLTYAEYGDPHGSPLFFLHGGNDSRLVGAIIDRSAFDLGIHIIAPDRPGYGRSDFQPGRTLLDWAADLAELAAALSIGRFAIAGHSGGGPHALAVAHALPERCAGVTLIASAGPPGSSNRGMHPIFRLVNALTMRFPRLNRIIQQRWADQVTHTPDQFFEQWGRASQADGALFQARPEIREIVAAEMAEAAARGLDGILHEHALYKRPWGFDLGEIRLPVHVWHGLADPQAVPAWGEALVAQLANPISHFMAGEGHFSLLVNCQREILAAIIVNGEV